MAANLAPRKVPGGKSLGVGGVGWGVGGALATREDPTKRALAQRDALRKVERRWWTKVGAWVLGTVGFTVGVAMAMATAEPVTFGLWIAMLKVAALSSPVWFLGLRAAHRQAQRERQALAEAGAGELAALPESSLSKGLGRFLQNTRMLRVALGHAADHDEAIRQLWEWVNAWWGLSEGDRESAMERGAGLGPIGALIGRGHESSPDLDDAAIARCVAHLEHIEFVLSREARLAYR